MEIQLKRLLFGEEARIKLKAGVDKLANAVKTTLGPGGRNVIIQRYIPHITKDGVTVAMDIVLEDEVERIGCDILKRAAIKTGSVAGDGTTTSTVLAQEIFNEGIKAIENHNPIEMKAGMDATVKEVVAELKKLSLPVNGDIEKIRQIAHVSSNGDTEVSSLISEAMSKIKVEGIVTVEESRTGETKMEVVEGLKFNKGFLSPYFINHFEKMECVLHDVAVIIYDKKVGLAGEIVGILDHIMREKKQVLLIAEDVEGEALSFLALNARQQRLSNAAVRNPGYGENAVDHLEDIAVVTGGSVVSEAAGMSLKNMDPVMLGYAAKVIVSKDSTTIIGGSGDREAIQARVNQIKEQISATDGEKAKEVLRSRLAALDGGVAVLHIGAPTEVEMKERKDRVDDALHATRAAVEEGVLPGGGVALLRVFKEIESVNIGNTESEIHGATIVKKALLKPFRQIIENATGVDNNEIMDKVLSSEDIWFGYDSRSKTFKNLKESGIIDPTKVVRATIENAVSVAGILLTTECVSYNPELK